MNNTILIAELVLLVLSALFTLWGLRVLVLLWMDLTVYGGVWEMDDQDRSDLARGLAWLVLGLGGVAANALSLFWDPHSLDQRAASLLVTTATVVFAWIYFRRARECAKLAADSDRLATEADWLAADDHPWVGQ